MYSEEDFLYSSGGEDVGIDDSDPPSNTKDFIILTEDKIKQLQDKFISEVSNVLSVSRGIACTLLVRQKWSLNSVVEKWLANDDGVSEVIAVMEVPKSENYCQICFETVENGNILSLPCGHPFCGDCWRSYLASSVNDGPGCLNLRCPQPKCKTTVGLDMVESLLSDDHLNKYYYYLYRSYIECSTNRKWCPAPECEYAVEFSAGGCESYDVTCDCSYKFCWKCAEECHRPVNCETVLNWTKKNKTYGANFVWISAHTKPCPKCKRPIEKNNGCNIMRCEKHCGFRFCWLCLKDLSLPGHRCNVYGEEKKQESSSLKNMRAEVAKYSHYFERWDSNDKSRDIALVQMNRARNEHVPILSEVQGQAENLLQRCVAEAWEQIVECRRVLKWTYAYGYYMDVDKVKKTFFEYLQGEAESSLERLHYCAAKEMDKYVKARCDDFPDFRAKLTCLTKVTGKYFQNLVRAMENNLCEVDDQVAQTRKRLRTSIISNF